MRASVSLAILIATAAACSPAAPHGSSPRASASIAPKPTAEAAPELLAADTPKTTVKGNTFVAPAGWTLRVSGPATILDAPEAGSHIALVDVTAADAEAAVRLAWEAYKKDHPWPLKVTTEAPDKDGWSRIKRFEYQTSPNEKRDVVAGARFANGVWTVILYDVAHAVGEKRGAQVQLVFSKLLPKGFVRESFAGKTANVLDEARIAALGQFIETAQQKLGVPGVSLGLVQGGKVIFTGGYGVRTLRSPTEGKPEKPDGDTKYIVASNTKALTTLMLARLVDEKKLGWDTQATALLPTFKLGDADTTGKVLVKHLICACTGMPRQDMEWLLQFQGVTPDGVMTTLGTMQPTSKFGELFQYSNPLAAAAGFIGGHVAYPKLELGKAYDEAMRTRVFEPLGMKATTFDFKRGQTGNFAGAHAPDVDGKAAGALMGLNYSVIPVRPAGGAWSTVKDLLAYVQMELAEGKLPDGKPYLEKDTLLARRAPQVPLSVDGTYGMGLMVEHRYDVTVVHHGGDLVGYHSDMMWLPEHGVGAVILTNGDPGWLIRSIFRRKLLEVLFDGRPEADNDVAAAGKTFFEQMAAERKLMTIPADAASAGNLAARYANAALGEIAVSRNGAATVFDFGEWKSEVASQKNPDGTVSFLTTAPGIIGIEFVVGAGAGSKRTLTLRDAQHEYVFDEK
jgi:CubicO group peptidase (beta-lactamase class C family)